MKLFLIIVAAIVTATLVLALGCSALIARSDPPVEQAAPPRAADNPLLWNDAKASLAVEDSAWAANRQVDLATCYGTGDYETNMAGQTVFREFNCALSGRNGEDLGRIHIYVTGPDEFSVNDFSPPS